MSKLDDLQNKIKQQSVGATGRRVLLVEGPDDEQAFRAWLGKVSVGWENQWVIAIAEKKSNVLGLLEREANWIGVVDQDEWTADVIEQKQLAVPNLWVLPRFCLENYLCDPEELWTMLPPLQQQKIEGGYQAFTDAITAQLPLWLQHGALWHVVNPLWEGLRALGFKDQLLGIQNIGNEQVVRQTLNDWHQFLEPDQIWANYQTRLTEVQRWPSKQQLSRAIHGKHFFPEVVHAVLSQWLGQTKASKRQNQLLQNAIPSPDLQPLWQKMGLIA